MSAPAADEPDGRSDGRNFTSDRPLPHSFEAERAILGAILLGGTEAEEAFCQLQSIDFFLHHHQVLFRHMLRFASCASPQTTLSCSAILLPRPMNSKSLVVSPISVRSRMACRDVSNVEHYIEIVKLKAQLRQRAFTAQAIPEMALGANGNAVTCLNQIGMLSAH